MNEKLEELMYDLTCVGTIKGQNETKAAIRELFQAKVYADANVGELITALRMDAYKHGVANGLYSCERGTIDKCLEKETAANAAEDALRKALGVQR